VLQFLSQFYVENFRNERHYSCVESINTDTHYQALDAEESYPILAISFTYKSGLTFWEIWCWWMLHRNHSYRTKLHWNHARL